MVSEFRHDMFYGLCFIVPLFCFSWCIIWASEVWHHWILCANSTWIWNVELHSKSNYVKYNIPSTLWIILIENPPSFSYSYIKFYLECVKTPVFQDCANFVKFLCFFDWNLHLNVAKSVNFWDSIFDRSNNLLYSICLSPFMLSVC